MTLHPRAIIEAFRDGARASGAYRPFADAGKMALILGKLETPLWVLRMAPPVWLALSQVL